MLACLKAGSSPFGCPSCASVARLKSRRSAEGFGVIEAATKSPFPFAPSSGGPPDGLHDAE
eukprot:scaffold213922_cov28-Tisochrysis_lutea.AAC.2